jgi:MHS family proline/betaine transporter-like MFS transporter
MSSAVAQPRDRVSRGSLIVAAFSTIVEWYDFTLYLYFATVLSRVFFGGGAGALIVTLAAFAVAYLMRPLGAVIFGHIGDRFGRRRMMLLTMALMSVAMLATALLPTDAQVGATAGWTLLVLRCFMAFSVGGEYTGVTAYLLEGARRDRRGLVTSFASGASEVGALLAVAVSAITISVMSQETLDAWGWRIPFFVGAALAGAVWIARSIMEESPDFVRQQISGTIPRNPLLDTLKYRRVALLRTFAISALASITYYVGIIYVPSYLTSSGALSEGNSLWLSTVAAVAVILVTPFFGALSDRFGRRPVLIVLAIAAAALPLAMFSLMGGGSFAPALIGAIVLACVAGGTSAVGPAAAAEQFPGEGRLSGLALGATVATTVFGGFTPYVAQLLMEQTGWPMVPGAMIAVVAACVLPVLIFMPETAPIGSASDPSNDVDP